MLKLRNCTVLYTKLISNFTGLKKVGMGATKAKKARQLEKIKLGEYLATN